MFKITCFLLKSNKNFWEIPLLCVNIFSISWWIYAILRMCHIRCWPGCILDIFSGNRHMLCRVNIWKTSIPWHRLTSKINRLVLLNFNPRQIVFDCLRTMRVLIFDMLELIFLHVFSNVRVLDHPGEGVGDWVMAGVLRLILRHSIS